VNYLAAQGEWVKLLRENRVAEAKRLYDGAKNFAQFRQLVVPAGTVFVLGDNMTNSEDSRNFGPIPVKDIVGRARLDVDPTIAMRIEFAPTHHARQQTRNLEQTRPTG